MAPLVGGWLAGFAGYQVLFAVALAITGVGLAVLHWSVREPRDGHVMAQQPEHGV